MPNTRHMVDTICPFFIRETGKAIYCEGVIPGSITISRFERPEVKGEFQESVCDSWAYAARCPLAEAVEKHYDALSGGEKHGK